MTIGDLAIQLSFLADPLRMQHVKRRHSMQERHIHHSAQGDDACESNYVARDWSVMSCSCNLAAGPLAG